MQSNEQRSSSNTVTSNNSKHGHATRVVNEKGEIQWEQDLLQVIKNSESTKDVPLTK